MYKIVFYKVLTAPKMFQRQKQCQLIYKGRYLNNNPMSFPNYEFKREYENKVELWYI